MASSYNAAYINITGDLYVDASGSSLATFSASNANIANLTATTVNATNLDFDNLSVQDALTINGSFDLNGLNNYEKSYVAGDVIGYNTKWTLDTSGVNAYWSYVKGLGGATGAFFQSFVPTATNGMTVYELVYWGNDTRSNIVTRMSATLLVPNTLTRDVIVSYKHGNITSVAQLSTVWDSFPVYKPPTTLDGTYGDDNIDPSPVVLAQAGYLVVCADNPGYGASVGSNYYSDPASEATSQYESILATKNLIALLPNLFNNAFTVSPIPVIQTGYSLGGMSSLPIVQLIRADTSNNLNCINCVAGAPINGYGLSQLTNSNAFLRIPYQYYVFGAQLNYSGIYKNVSSVTTRPNIISDIFPLFDPFYVNTSLKNDENWSTTVVANTIASVYGSYFAGSIPAGFLPSGPANDSSSGYIVPGGVYDASSVNKFTNIAKQVSFYTNPFIDYTDVSGVPITIIYSTTDPYICYDPSGYVGGGNYNYGDILTNPVGDNVKNYLKGFMTDTSFTNILGNSENRPPNSLGRSTNLVTGYNDTSGYGADYNLATAAPVTTTGLIVTQLITAELALKNSGYLWALNPGVSTPLTHGEFSFCHANILYNYLSSRS